MELTSSSERSGEDPHQQVFQTPAVDPRPMMDVLFDCSWQQSEKQISQGAERFFYKNRPSDFLEGNKLQGWLTSFPITDNQRLQQPTNPESKKRKSLYCGATDSDDYYFLRRKSQFTLPDYHNPGVLWRSIVEADTYRYIANNGCYRYLKTSAALGKDAKTIFQKRTNTFVSPTVIAQNQARKEITRDLHRVLEGEDHIAREKARAEQLATQRENCNKDQLLDSGRNSQTETSKVSETETNSLSEEIKDNSLAELMKAYKNEGHPPSESPFQLPSVDVPLLSKAFAERLMENFSSKISALEDEIRQDAKKMSQKSAEDVGKLRRSSLQDFLLTDSVVLKHSDPPSSAKSMRSDRKVSFPKNTFQVISVYKSEGKKPLKPLEKVTPTMRQAEDTHKMQMAHLRYNSVKGNSESCTRYSFSDSVINPIKLTENLSSDKPESVPPDFLGKDKILNVNNITVFSTMKTGDAPLSSRTPAQTNAMPNGKKIHLHAKVKRPKTMPIETGDKVESGFHSAPVGKPKQKDTKNPGTPADDISQRKYLPQLMGKKMPVSISVQKWL